MTTRAENLRPTAASALSRLLRHSPAFVQTVVDRLGVRLLTQGLQVLTASHPAVLRRCTSPRCSVSVPRHSPTFVTRWWWTRPEACAPPCTDTTQRRQSVDLRDR
eukprot:1191939-Prorocentrum_minimum.AAC.3